MSDFSGSGNQASLEPRESPDGPRDMCSFYFPLAMALDGRLQRLLVSDMIGLRQVDLQTGATRTILRWAGHHHALKMIFQPIRADVSLSDFADGPVEIASLGSRTSVANIEIGSDRRPPIVEMHFSHDFKKLFFVNSRKDFIRSLSVAGPAGVDIRDSSFKDNKAPLGAGLNVHEAQSPVTISGSVFAGDVSSVYACVGV